MVYILLINNKLGPSNMAPMASKTWVLKQKGSSIQSFFLDQWIEHAMPAPLSVVAHRNERLIVGKPINGFCFEAWLFRFQGCKANRRLKTCYGKWRFGFQWNCGVASARKVDIKEVDKATSFPGSFISSPPWGEKMKDPGNEVEQEGVNFLRWNTNEADVSSPSLSSEWRLMSKNVVHLI